MKTAVLIVATVVAAAAACGTASAQTFGVYVGPAYDDYSYYDGPPAYPRASGYSLYEDGTVVREYRRGGCGTYRFWDGERCVDARWK